MRYFLEHASMIDGNVTEREISEEEYDSDSMGILMRSHGYVKFMRADDILRVNPEPSYFW